MAHNFPTLTAFLAASAVLSLLTSATAAPTGVASSGAPVEQGPGRRSNADRDAAERRAADVVAAVGADALRAYQMPNQERYNAMVGLLQRSLDWGFVLRNSVPSDLMTALDDAERISVARALLMLSAESYASAFPQYDGEQLDITGINLLGQGVAMVSSRLRSPTIDGGLAIDWVVAGLDSQRAGLRDLIVDGGSLLQSQQLAISALWDESGNDKAAFMERINSSDPWGDG